MFVRSCDNSASGTTTKPACLSAVTFLIPMISRGDLFTGFRVRFTVLVISCDDQR